MKHGKNTSKMVPITVSGARAILNTSTIPKQGWKSCHGEFNGIRVDSLKVAFYGDSIVIERADGFQTSYDVNEFGVLVAQFLELYKTVSKA